MTLIPVILSGGGGTRLWPLSRQAYPKQFLALPDGRESLFQTTVKRCARLKEAGAPIIVTHADYRFLIQAHLKDTETTDSDIILEPCRRNTAPAIALAALRALERNANAMLIVMPSDHLILNEDAFGAAVATAQKLAADGRLATFGIVPTGISEEYGYICAGAPMDGYANGAFSIARFVEKPKADAARALIEGGNVYWNSGIFLFRADAYIAELERIDPSIVRACRAALASAKRDFGFVWADETAFAASPDISIDYAVMEKTALAAVVPVDMGWSDVGSWSSLWDASDKSGQNNVTHGDVTCTDTKNSLIYTERGSVLTLGVEDTIVVETPDALLVARRGREQELKKLVEARRAAGRTDTEHHREVHRPWGSYEQLDLGANFQVKKLRVLPGACLSLQKHKHRSEHWVVVKGEATVTKDEAVLTLKVNESIAIPVGTVHRLENKKNEILEVIEVQTGSYLGEDDIIRFSDHYGRVPEEG